MSTTEQPVAERIRVLTVDDHPVVREGLAARIAQQPDMVLCGEAADVIEALRLVEVVTPDVAVIDISLKGGSGLELIKRLKGRDSQLRMIVWSMYEEGLYAERALRAGAMGYVSKDSPTECVIEAIRRVSTGKVYLSEGAADRMLRRAVGGAGAPGTPGIDLLSDRELEVFGMIGRGLTTQQIAEAMRLSPKTVETYRARIREKLNVVSGPELVVMAARWVADSG